MWQKFTGCTLICLLWMGYAAFGQEFTATASPATVAVGGQVQVSFTLYANSGSSFRAPSFPDFNILMGPIQSSSRQNFNGTITQTITLSYVLQAVREGTFKIGSASVDVNGKRLVSNPFTITVTKGSAPAPWTGAETNATVETSKNVFLRTSVDKSSVYRGEGLVCTIKLYTRVALVNFGQKKSASLNGFWSQDIDLSQQPELKMETLNGVTYKVAEIKKMVLFPQRSGTLQIDPMEVEVIARVQVKRNRANDPYDPFMNDPFFSNLFGNAVQDIKVPLRSPTVSIHVKELPPAPAGFSGAVGKYSLEVTSDKKEVKAHDPITLRVTISGRGNLKLMDPPPITFPPDFEKYDPKINSNLKASPQGVSGSKSFEYLVIPRNAGEYKMDVMPFIYFNPESKQYQTISGSTLMVKVLKGEGGEMASPTVSGITKEDVQLLGKDIRYIKTSPPGFQLTTNTIYRSPLFYALSISPALIFIGLIFVKRSQEQHRSNPGLLRSRQAGGVARRRLATAKKLKDQPAAFLDEMSRALWGYVSDRLQIPVANLSRDTVSQHLAQRTVSETAIREFLEVLEDCEVARFAPAGIAKSPAEIYDRGIRVIASLEEQMKSA